MRTVNELLADDATSHAVNLHQYSSGVVRRLIGLLNKVDADLADALAAALERLPRETFTVERLEKLLRNVRRLNVAAYDAVQKELTPELKKFAEYEAEYQKRLFVQVIPDQIQARFSIASVNGDQVYAAAMSRPFQGRLLKDWADKLEEDRLTIVRDAVRVGYIEGKTTSEIVRGLKGTRAANYADGKIDRPRRDLEVVVRMAINHTASVVRQKFIAANEDIVDVVQWHSTLDTRTSEWCRVRDKLKYTAKKHAPIGHKIPWLGGPGKIHWNAICPGTLIKTKRGELPIESVIAGDFVLTHMGNWKVVSAHRNKIVQNQIVRTVHTNTGRILRATDDHPVAMANGRWKFVGALELGDELLCDPKELGVVVVNQSVVSSASEYGPAVGDELHVSLKRTLKLVSADVDFEGNLERWASKVDDCAASLILRDPSIVEGQSALHHLLSLADALQKLGRQSLSNLLSGVVGNNNSATGRADYFTESDPVLGGHDLLHNRFDLGWVVILHAFRVSRKRMMRFLSQTIRPVLFTARHAANTVLNVKDRLVSLCANGYRISSRKLGKSAICKAIFPLNRSERSTGSDMLGSNDCEKIRNSFTHERIVSLAMQTYDGALYDLEVETDESYVANGIVVSNCRSVELPVTKSWRDLGFDIDELSPATRASMSGQVAGDTDYGDWLQRQTAARQDQVVGVTRGQLMRAGKLEFDKLYSARGEWLSLEQLRERESAAFTKAGL